jgi:hypothetical protein
VDVKSQTGGTGRQESSALLAGAVMAQPWNVRNWARLRELGGAGIKGKA